MGDSHTATFACATHEDRAGAEGGALIVVASCPAPTVEVEFTLQARSRLDQSIPFPTVDPDAGIDSTSETPGTDASSEEPAAGDAGSPDAGVSVSDAAPELDAAQSDVTDPSDAAASVPDATLDAAL